MLLSSKEQIHGLLENGGLGFTSNEMHHDSHQVWKHGNVIGSICHITYCDVKERAVLVIAVENLALIGLENCS